MTLCTSNILREGERIEYITLYESLCHPHECGEPDCNPTKGLLNCVYKTEFFLDGKIDRLGYRRMNS